jgi:hypothetical protein
MRRDLVPVTSHTVQTLWEPCRKYFTSNFSLKAM